MQDILTDDYNFDAVVVGIGHAGVEAALALARKGFRTLALSISLDNAGYLACNPSIGGTAKGHLVREVDALGGEMGVAADKCLSHLRMLNSSKGPAVHSLRAQVDKYKYHNYIKNVLENTENLFLRQGEAKEILVENNKVTGIKTVTGLCYYAKTVVLACGVYLDSTIIIGDVIEKRGPVCFARSNYLAEGLKSIGFKLRRFKTGTPARVKKDSIDFESLEIQGGEDTPYSFSVISKEVNKKDEACYLGYTNPDTHQIIRDNLALSPKYGGLIHGAGARYCPSVEDKIVKFADKNRHQFFLEPEGKDTQEMYVQGLSTGLPAFVQLMLYRSIKGFEKVEIMRDAYAIEYECIDSLQLYPSLESKHIKGLYFAGQINGTSGYEEAAAQGLIAGINAALSMENKPPLILSRDSSYIGVLIDDLCTVGTEEPYRMMTSRAEYRLLLRQDNADLRLTEIGRNAGLVDDKRWKIYLKKLKEIEKAQKILDILIPQNELEIYFNKIGAFEAKSSMTVREVLKRNYVTENNFCESFSYFDKVSPAAKTEIFIETKYEGYLSRERRTAMEAKRLEKMRIPAGIDFAALEGLRNEAKEKLALVKPLTIGQAGRISGVTPSDINVLIIKLRKR